MKRQGQGNNPNPFQTGNFYSDGDVGSDQHNVVPDGHTSMRRNGQTSSNIDTQNHVGFAQFLGDDFLLSPLGDQTVTTQTFETSFNPLLQNNSRSAGNDPIEPSLGADSGVLQHSFDLNDVEHPERTRIDASQGNGPYIGSGGDNIQTLGGSSSPVMIYSGVAGYVIEENISPDELPVEGQRRLICKRKAPELASGSACQAQNSQQPMTMAQNNASINSLTAANNDHSGLGATLPTSSNSYQFPSEARQVYNFQSNTRLRTANQPVATPTNLWTWNSSNSRVQPTGQHPFTLSISATALMLVNSTVQPFVQVSNSSQALQHYWNGTNLSWVGPSSVPLDQAVNVPANLNLVNENVNASSSRIQSGSSRHLPNSSIRSPIPNMAAQYGQRGLDIVNPSESWRRGSFCPILPSASPDARPAQVPLRLGPRAERQAGRHSGVPLYTGQRRRLISEFRNRNAFGLVRMPAALRVEDVMVIDGSYLYGMPEVPDILEDMRLDVDNMSYEELLELEEQIGNVCTGLSEETILANLTSRKYQSGPPEEIEPCCICQEDYAEGEELGKLGCGHEFHFNCIKQWLMQKNSCPICKNTALAV
ncbi:Caffeoyl-CoA O-methyltransferase 1 [Hibiscus syriacus]|uniref:RING-type E3 ubiquitin transferase n=2 Tax=Hibiscus syriacus TaxID=106335 RepID=A0A6A2YEE6_HIBSY|nr:Caffeoyl-CoA O-methyltransferase 1 [Hibiscus syriacus]